MTTGEHLWTPEEWAQITDGAKLAAVRIAAGLAPQEAPAAHGVGTGLLPLSGVVVAARHGGRRAAPTFGVLHSAETPLANGYAASIARMFATTTADKSCHYMTDPAETWGVLDDLAVAWHCGDGNTNSIGLEQSGYARFTRAQWLAGGETGPGYAQLRRNAAVIRAARRYGIGPYWMSDAQLLLAHRRQITGGWATHDQCRAVLGGTTHTDPGPGFPRDLQMQLAAGEDKDEDMPLTPQDVAAVSDAVANRPIGKWPDGSGMEAWEAWRAAALFTTTSTAAVAAAVLKALPSGATGGLTAAQVEAATAAGLRTVLREGVK